MSIDFPILVVEGVLDLNLSLRCLIKVSVFLFFCKRHLKTFANQLIVMGFIITAIKHERLKVTEIMVPNKLNQFILV